jgi:adenosine kinase
VIAGELTTRAVLDYSAIARGTVRDIGYDTGELGFDRDAVGVLVTLDKQSPDIAQGVDASQEARTRQDDHPYDQAGAGDQGMMFGYATNETPSPVLIGAAGADFAEHGAWLERHGVDTSAVRVSEARHTARFVCTTDRDHNQIATFYSGAMQEARRIDLTEVAQCVGGLAITIISPNDPEAMLRHTSECREHGYEFLADPSQQLARADGAMAQALVEGAAGLFTNEYERELLGQKSGWSASDILDRVGVWVTTLGRRGAAVDRKGAPTILVPAVPPRRAADPTGVGDAFRAGFIAGLAWDLGDLRSAQLGCALATLALEAAGPQEYAFSRAGRLRRFAAAYGGRAAADVAPHLPVRTPSAR